MAREFGGRVIAPGDLFALRYVHDARWSPEGLRIASVISRTDEATGKEYFEIALGDSGDCAGGKLSFAGRATFPRWSPDGTRLAFVGATESSQRLYVADLQGRVIDALTPEDCHVEGPPSWSADGVSIVYATVIHRKREGIARITRRVFRAENLGVVEDRTAGLQSVDIRTGAVRAFDVTLTSVFQPAFSPCGRHVLFLGARAPVSRAGYGGLNLFVIDLADGRVRSVLTDGWSIAAAAWTVCGERIVVVGVHGTEITVPTMGLWIVDRDGSDPQCRTRGYVGNVGMRAHHDMPTWNTSQNHNIVCVPNATHAYATVATRGCTEIWRIRLDGAPHCEPVVRGERSCVIMDASAKTGQLLYCVSDLRTPWELYQSNLDGDNEKRLTHLNDEVLAQHPALDVEHLKFASADDTPLEGWYLGREDRRGPQPTVMFIHGGPFLATGHAFRFDFHLLAANGYAVLFANFRGSAGYGEAFARSIMGDWGARGFPDHMAAVDGAVARGLANPDRLGVWGPSHGGFATCWIVGHTTRFRAAVAESSVCNFSSLYYLCDVPDMFARDLGGRPHEIPDVYRSRSPLTYAWRCRTPTLLLHGEEDLRCPVAEAEQFYRALHDANCTTELVRVQGMNHMGDSTGPLSARYAQNEALLDWFERHL